MKQRLIALFNEAKAYLHQDNPKMALENFQTLQVLLEKERNVAHLKQKVDAFIKVIENPALLKKAQEKFKKIQEEQKVISALKEQANIYYQTREFEKAVEEYQKLSENLESYSGSKDMIDLADAYWNVGLSYEAWACAIKEKDVMLYNDLLVHAEFHIKKAKNTYPLSCNKDIKETDLALARIAIALKAISLSFHKPAVSKPLLKQDEPSSPSSFEGSSFDVKPLITVPAKKHFLNAWSRNAGINDIKTPIEEISGSSSKLGL